MWKYNGQHRPEFAEEPGPGMESVWDFPRPPKLEPINSLVEVWNGEQLVARSNRCLRLLETASPPQFYIPPEDVVGELLIQGMGRSMCEWKGAAHYWALSGSPDEPVVGWGYKDARPPFSQISDFFAFYANRLQCFVDGERVEPQPGSFYGGWITPQLSGPFKGEPGTGHW